MRKRLAEHIGSMLVVALIFGVLIVLFREHEDAVLRARQDTVKPYRSMQFLDFGNPLHRALFLETLNVFRPDSLKANEDLLRAIDAYREAEFTEPALKAGAAARGLTLPLLGTLGSMFLNFVVAFVVALLCTMYSAQTLAVYRFVAMKQGRESLLRMLWAHLGRRGETSRRSNQGAFVLRALGLLAGALLKGVVTVILFAPAYVIGYALMTEFGSGGIPYMIVLGVVSNGLLMMYANRFFTMMVSESRKGYVETAIAKGLSRNWAWNRPGGIRLTSLFRLRKRFPSHILGHIYLNARYQYLPSTKEQASFLITGLIIAEMALNIQGHLGYEMMQKILDQQYDVVLAIAFAIFVAVKLTDIVVDWQWTRETRRYENLG